MPPSSRPTRLVALATLLGAVGLGCPTQQRVPLALHGSVDDALVTIDDRYVGKLGEVERRGVGLLPGRHRITVEQVGFFPFDVLVEADEAPLDVEVELERVPD
ncbi:MAG: hypothetical protein HY908_23915 [Myxococcales bacterium]|nr:hypothetical protein [Myxococcales bacterium]